MIMGRDNSRIGVRILHNIAMACLCVALLGFGGAKITDRRSTGVEPPNTLQMIYVADFDVDAEDIHSGPGLLKPRRQMSGQRPGVLSKPLVGEKNPAERARDIVELMATSLVKDLTKLGLDARRIQVGNAWPAEGLLVRGVFTEVGEGNRLRRAAVGFGAGETELQIYVAVSDLRQGSPQPFYEFDTSAESRKLPGAVITMNPYVAGAKYVLSGRDLEKNVTNTASMIARDIAGHMKK